MYSYTRWTIHVYILLSFRWLIIRDYRDPPNSLYPFHIQMIDCKFDRFVYYFKHEITIVLKMNLNHWRLTDKCTIDWLASKKQKFILKLSLFFLPIHGNNSFLIMTIYVVKKIIKKKNLCHPNNSAINLRALLEDSHIYTFSKYDCRITL